MSAEPPAVKAAPKRRRGGKHRHKGLTAEAATEAAAEAPAEAGVSDKEDVNGAQPAAEHALSDGALSDNLARLQLDRLASNAAAGTLPAFACTPMLTIHIGSSSCSGRTTLQVSALACAALHSYVHKPCRLS